MANSQAYVYGAHAVEALLEYEPERIKIIYIQQQKADQRLQHLINFAKQQNIAIQQVSRHKLDELVENENHQGIVALCIPQKISEISLEELLDNLREPPFLLILDGIQDPHNLGACLRSANAAGIHAVIAPKDRAVGLTPVAKKVASGAAELTPFIQVTNLARTLKMLKERGVWIYGTAEDANETIYEIDLKGSIALVLGAEGSGLRRLTKELCDKLIRIPTVGKISSLNVSVATGVCLFEALRQRSNTL